MPLSSATPSRCSSRVTPRGDLCDRFPAPGASTAMKSGGARAQDLWGDTLPAGSEKKPPRHLRAEFLRLSDLRAGESTLLLIASKASSAKTCIS